MCCVPRARRMRPAMLAARGVTAAALVLVALLRPCTATTPTATDTGTVTDTLLLSSNITETEVTPAPTSPSTPPPTPAPTPTPPVPATCVAGTSELRGCNTCVCSGTQWVCTTLTCRAAVGDACTADNECGDGLLCRPAVDVIGLCRTSKVCKAKLPLGADCGGVVAPCYENECAGGLKCSSVDPDVEGQCVDLGYIPPTAPTPAPPLTPLPPVRPKAQCGVPEPCGANECYHVRLCSCGAYGDAEGCSRQTLCEGVVCDLGFTCIESRCGGCYAVCVPDDADVPVLGFGEVCATAVAIAERLYPQGIESVTSSQCALDYKCAPRASDLSTQHAVDHTCSCPAADIQCPADECYNPGECRCGAFEKQTCVNPCKRANHCGRGYVCEPNFCGGCHATCVVNVVSETDTDYCLWTPRSTQPWTRDQRDYCCENRDARCASDTYTEEQRQCNAVAASGLRSEKCCRNFGVACAADPYQCFAGYEAMNMWNVTQAGWCCRYRNVCKWSCQPAYSTEAAENAEECCSVLGICGVRAVDVDEGQFFGQNYSEIPHRLVVSLKFEGTEDLAYTIGLFENPHYLLRVVRRAMLVAAPSLRPEGVVVQTVGIMTSDENVPQDSLLDRWTIGYTAQTNERIAQEEADDEAFLGSRMAGGDVNTTTSRGASLPSIAATATPAGGVKTTEHIFFVAELLSSQSYDDVVGFRDDLRDVSDAERAHPSALRLVALKAAPDQTNNDSDVEQEFFIVVPFACCVAVTIIGLVARRVLQRKARFSNPRLMEKQNFRRMEIAREEGSDHSFAGSVKEEKNKANGETGSVKTPMLFVPDAITTKTNSSGETSVPLLSVSSPPPNQGAGNPLHR